MRRAWARSTVALLSALVSTAVLASCAAPQGAASPPGRGSLARAADLTGQSYVVGAHRTDEQQLLCKITALALESAGASVTDRCAEAATAGTDAARAALVSGDLNITWEYAGQVWTGALGQTKRPPDDELYSAVAQRDLANGIVWLDRSGFDSNAAFAVEGTKAAQLGLRSLTDMANYIRSGQPGTVCVDTEYGTRPDGIAGLQKSYGFTVAPDRLQVLDTALVHQSTADGVCTFGEVSTTDGRIAGLGLTLLDDDRRHHVPNDAAPTIRKDAFDRDPDVAAVLDAVSTALDDRTIRTLNGRVSADGMAPGDVARGWLVERGFVS